MLAHRVLKGEASIAANHLAVAIDHNLTGPRGLERILMGWFTCP
jgi:hypothetical protein